MIQGKADYKPGAGFEDAMHVIGEGHNPVYVCRKGDIPKMFTVEFYNIFHLWRFFHQGLQPPQGSWGAVHPEVLECLMAMENHFESHFSTELGIFKMLESIRDIMVNYIKAMSKRR